jgi:hypothetical protein
VPAPSQTTTAHSKIPFETAINFEMPNVRKSLILISRLGVHMPKSLMWKSMFF